MKKLFSVAVAFVCKIVIAQTTLLNVDFQTGIPAAFSIVDQDGNTPDISMTEFLGQNAWITLPDPEDNTNVVASATSYFSPIDTADRWLITPALNLGAFGNKISWWAKSHDPSYPDDYLVLVSHTDAEPSSFTDTIGNIEEENFEWTNRSVDLSQNGYDDSTIYIAFVLRTFDGFMLYLDDFLVEKDIDTNSTEMLSVLSINIYPNPVTKILTIDGLPESFKGEIISFNNQLVRKFDTKSIDLEDLSAGVYFLFIKFDNQLIKVRFIKN